MAKTELYVVRHGKTMFNTVQRVQGWCDTPLTKTGAEGIRYLGLALKDTDFKEAYASDSGRAIETARIILGENSRGPQIPFRVDKRIREWCFGSLEGGYDAEMWGVVPRVLNFKNYDEMIDKETTFKEICEAIYDADTANWAETYDELSYRVHTGFEDIAHRVEKNGGGKALVVSHGLTISFLLNLINEESDVRMDLANGSVTHLTYENGEFSCQEVGSTAYIEKGKEIAQAH
ncbi:histidine phosphatase family protein [Tetragenococcus koreensis]|uniref:Phosphoglycerate mutase n=1 Tax=Tetragenococcus koreensis TaxID=290335 RepID=A0AAN4RLT0_9ENTE|nr:histidine phosphatase family protein [Tetragenococcus koreensis]AYW45076.1 histidine phosphatase family protein [Tetragenococcus koreensis]MCF1584360.1 histidine phosphatase family protein [Tetragenococcus koreensis]MCF1613909.1 histidine phosphatase family protein [Tetragenococcus koreensis]MCF1616100.1 histidine phosphatase family protein [Tetragenococcus koreensis]MCF1618548.1 histidine phosphatase family protein [Tetragenococcus koreensis]